MSPRLAPTVKLGKQPLVLVLCQVRFSPVENIKSYMPAIQDEFRKQGYPLLEHKIGIQRAVLPDGSIQKIGEIEQWIIKRKDEKASIIVDRGQVLYQTTDYDTFEPFAQSFLDSLKIVFSHTELVKFSGEVQQLGLRYVDVIQRGYNEEELKELLRNGFSGVSTNAFVPGTKRTAMETSGQTPLLEGQRGTLVVRLFQNDLGFDLPPDLINDALPREVNAEKGKLITILDMDHYVAGKFPASPEWVEEAIYSLHEHIINVFHKHIVTDKALEKWR